jgi:hypothetical protein
MKTKLAFAALLILLAGVVGRTQSTSAGTLEGPAGSHLTCSTPTAGHYYLCTANDGVWVSNNGAAYFAITQNPAGGVTSINGKAGALTITGATTITAQ